MAPDGGRRTIRPMTVLNRWARDFAFHATGLITSVLAFTVWVAGVSVTLSLAVTVLGILVALVFFWALRWIARIERRRASLVLAAPIGERYRRGEPDAGWFARLRAAAADPATWKDFAWAIVMGTVGFGLSVAVLCVWSVPFFLLSLPTWYWAPSPPPTFGIFEVKTLPIALACAGAGVLSIPLCGAIVRGLTRLELAMMVPLLRPPRGEELAERVDVLTTTRAGAVDAQAAELQRIERDLHDGAQARLVALAMSLGMAEEKLDSDPAQARELLTEARGEARTALTELRDLARGIHPPVLSDRGLEAAITSVAARSPVAVTIEADLPQRAPAAVEAAAYFVVTEALANATKHSGARTALVRLVLRDGMLIAEVADDGRGGADPRGSGLLGLRRRVEALDGTLSVVSPPGEGTTLHVEIPAG